VDGFDSASAQAIANSQAAFRNNAVKRGLIFIKTHYSTLPQVIKDLETRGLSLVEYVDIFEGAKLAVEKVSGDVGKKIQTKLKDVLARNPGIPTIMDVAVIHREGVGTPLTIKQTSALKFAPVTSCDVERSFSHYKTILSHRRQNLLPENIEKYLVSSWKVDI
jgi:hypothetical protein